MEQLREGDGESIPFRRIPFSSLFSLRIKLSSPPTPIVPPPSQYRKSDMFASPLDLFWGQFEVTDVDGQHMCIIRTRKTMERKRGGYRASVVRSVSSSNLESEFGMGLLLQSPLHPPLLSERGTPLPPARSTLGIQ